jgi:AcrR family transcriptional regulator
MIEKKEKILMTALHLFASKGYDATSTNHIAREAGVSEGLIFRHYTNKEGLLNAIMGLGRARVEKVYESILAIADPSLRLKAILTMPFNIPDSDAPLWKLLYALKWQRDIYDDSWSKDVRTVLHQTFSELGYADPPSETEFVFMMIDGIATGRLLRQPIQLDKIEEIILTKYNLGKNDF